MSEILKIAAEAISESIRSGDGAEGWVGDSICDEPCIGVDGAVFPEKLARAALSVLRTPTPEMRRILASAAKYGTEATGDLWPTKLMNELVDAVLAEGRSSPVTPL